MLAPSVIIPFDGNHADIPSGFTRETTLDGKYPKATANATNPNTTGGASTHSHTSPTHIHTLANHTHTYTLGDNYPDHSSTRSNGSDAPDEFHTHTGTTNNPSASSCGTTALTYASTSNDPAYYTVIFIKSTSYSVIPSNAMVMKEGTTRTDFTFHSASANKFLKGAGTGANAGGTGGSTTNTHSISHGHSAASHTHTTTSASTALTIITSGSWGALANHTHAFTTGSTSVSVTSSTASLVTSETVEPAYRKINAFKNGTGGSKTPLVGDIGMWLGTLTDIPVGWNLCDGTNDTPDMRSKFLKINTTATTTSTGGANTHTHAAAGHTHTSTQHRHSYAAIKHATGTHDGGSSSTIDRDLVLDDLYHAAGNTSYSTPSWGSTNTTANSSSNEPEYRTVAYIQFAFPPVVPNPILNMLIDRVENN